MFYTKRPEYRLYEENILKEENATLNKNIALSLLFMNECAAADSVDFTIQLKNQCFSDLGNKVRIEDAPLEIRNGIRDVLEKYVNDHIAKKE